MEPAFIICRRVPERHDMAKNSFSLSQNTLADHYSTERTILIDNREISIHRKKLGKTKEKPASAYIRIALEKRINIKPQHKNLRESILEKGLTHTDVTKRDKNSMPLVELEKKHFINLLNRIYGACVTQQPYLPAYEDLKKFVVDVFKQPALLNIHVGTIVSFLSNHCRSFFTMAKLDPNTSRKVIKQVAPQQASRRGRGSPTDKQQLAKFVQEHYGFAPIGI